MVGRDYVAWLLSARLTSELPPHLLRCSRLGPNADGQNAAWLQSPLPALRRASLREVLAMLERLVQVGHVATTNTDAPLDLSTMANQSAAIASRPCGAAGGILIRLGGNAIDAHEAVENHFSTQLAEVGYCPCCILATHVAMPVNYARGKRDASKKQGAALRKPHGHRGPRRSAAMHHQGTYGTAGVGWHWDARNRPKSTPQMLCS